MIRPKAGFSVVSWNEMRCEAQRRNAHAAAGDDKVPAEPEEGGRGHWRYEREGED